MGAILSQNLSTGPDKTYDLFFLKLTYFFVELCRDRRLRPFVKILAKSLFSYPCLGQNLSSTPVPDEGSERGPAGRQTHHPGEVKRCSLTLMRLNLCFPVLPWAISICLEGSLAQERG